MNHVSLVGFVKITEMLDKLSFSVGHSIFYVSGSTSRS